MEKTHKVLVHYLQELSNVEKIYKLQILNFSHKWHKKQPPIVPLNNISLSYMYMYVSDVHKYNARYASNAYFSKPRYRTNIGN